MEQDALRGDELQQQSEFFVSELLETMEEAGKPRTNELGVPRGEVSQLDSEGKYDKWGHNENPWKESDIEIDPETGWRYQMWNVGMTRNAKAENRKIEKVYLDPIRHVVKDQNVPLRGWYQSKFNESPLARPRPCESDAILTSVYGGTCQVNCKFCLVPETLINTPIGNRRIDSLKIGDRVYGRTNEGVVESDIIGIATRLAKSVYILRTDSNTFRVTGNHPVFVVGKGWTPVEKLEIGDEVESCDLSNLPHKASKSEGRSLVETRLLFEKMCGSYREESSSLFELWRSCLERQWNKKVLHQTRVRRSKKIRSWESQQRKRLLSRNKSEDESCYAGTSCKSSKGEAKICRVEEENGRESSCRDNWVQNFQENAVCKEGWEEGDLQVGVGMVGVSVVRQAQHSMGIRTRSSNSWRGSLSSRFQEIGHKLLYRDKRVVSGYEEGIDAEVYAGISNRDLGYSSVETFGYSTVIGLEEVEEETEVWDIQTSVENFYAGGILFHNCYINSGIRGYRGQGITVVDPTYPDKIRKQLSRMKTAAAGYMCSFIDPFMELEPYYKNTYRTATAFLDNKLPMFFLTRKTAPDWVYDYLRANPYSYMQFSINTSNPDDWQRLSPRANPLQMQIDQVRAMHEAGIYVSIQVNPIIGGITSNEDIVKLIHMLAEAGADHLIFKFVEIVTFSRKGMVQGMREAFKDAYGGGGNTRVDLFDYLFSEIIGGFYTIKEDYRKAALNLFSDECKRAGVTMATCYEYEYGRDSKGEITNKTGTSLGHKYLTADQCHGHRVPMFTRNSTDDPWQEIKGCPPSGCLRCQDQFPKEVPCHNPLLASAPALQPSDLLEPALLPKGSQHGVRRTSLKMVQRG